MNLDIWSILILFFVAQGIFTLSILILDKNRWRVISNVYLSIIILLVIWVLLEFLAIRNTWKINIDIFYGTRYGSWLIFGPLIYYYYKSITDKNWKLTLVNFLHLLPFLTICVVIPLISSKSLSPRQIDYGMLSVFDYRPKTVTLFEYFYSAIFFLQFIHFGLYLLFNFRIIKNYTAGLKKEYSTISNVIWLRILNVLLVITLFLSSIYLYILFNTDFYNRSLDYIYIIPMGLFIYSVGYKISGIKWGTINEKPKKYTTSSLTLDIKIELREQLELLMKNDELFLINELRIKNVADKLNVNTHHLSQLINEHYKCSFFEYINQYRIKKAKENIMLFPEKNLLKIAFESGFNNKTSFVNSFKKFAGTTPSQFRKSNK